MTVTSFEGNSSPSTPKAGAGFQTALVASATLPASGAWAASSVINVSDARRLNLWLSYDPGAAGGYPVIAVLISGAQAQPATTDDSWFAPQVNDGSVSATLLDGTMVTDVDVTNAPEWGLVTVRPLALRLEAGDATSDNIRTVIPVTCEPGHWAFVLYQEEGDTANPGTFALDYSLSA